MASNLDRPLLTGGEQLQVEVDRIAGFGPKFHPWSVNEARESIRPQVIALQASFREMPTELRGDRVVMQATMVPNYVAPSYFPSRLLEESDLVVLGSRVATAPYETASGHEEGYPTKALLLGGTADSIQALDRLSADTHPSRRVERIQEGFQSLRELRLPGADEVILSATPPESGLYEAVLHPSWDSDLQRVVPASASVYEKWVHFVESLGGDVVSRYRRVVGALTFVPVHLARRAVPHAADFNPLRVLRPMPQLRPVPVAPLRSVGQRAAPRPPAEQRPSSTERVAVFDGGWDSSCPFTRPFVSLHELTPEPADTDCVEHGSAVTAAALFGEVDDVLPIPSFSVDHYRVLPVPAAEQDFDLNWVLDRIIDTVRGSDHRLVNLSLGPRLAIDDSEPHRWTAALDELAAEQDVLFVSAVGNDGDADATTGLNRVQVPADMANGLGIGSCDSSHAQAFSRSPFSCVGPGRQGARVKPTGVAFGGDGAGNPYVGLGMSGRWYEGHGTSFSTPLVTRATGTLLPYVPAGHSTVDLLRAMAVHFAQPGGDHTSIEEVGYGRVVGSLEECLSCETDNVTVVYADTLSRGDALGLPIPLPDDMTGGVVTLRWTLAVTSPVDPADAAEYTLAGVNLQFRPHALRIPFTPPGGGQAVLVDVGQDPDKATALLRQGYRMSANPATRAGRRVRLAEEARRDESRWETLVHARDSLRSSSLYRPRFDLSYWARLHGQLQDSGADDLPFTLLVTVDAPRGSRIYDRVRSAFPVLVPIEARVTQRVRID